MNHEQINISELCVDPGESVDISELDSAWLGTSGLQQLAVKKLEKHAKKFLKSRRKELSNSQELLYGSDRYSLLIIFQGRDAAGKDSTIKHVMRGVNPQGCQVFSFKKPSKEELDHNYMWRCWKGLPERGRIGIFNRSYYEEVLVVRVHPEILEGQKLPQSQVTPNIWRERFEDINAFEKHMSRNGTVILKFFLNVSKEEQKQRFIARLREPEKHWKFSEYDLEVRKHWDSYTPVVNEMLQATSTDYAPWYVIPADYKWVMRAVVGHVITTRIQELNLKMPEADAEKKAALEEALIQLENE